MNRRGFLALAAAGTGFQPPQDITPLIREITRGAAPREGGVEIELPQVAENGNSVPIRIRVASPMTEDDHVKAIHLFAERNPRPRVATFHLGPDCGRAEINARMRLAGTQTVTVLAELSNRRFTTGTADVLVTSGACLDEGSL
jgi:sulfur-oxidizing protein SoxY